MKVNVELTAQSIWYILSFKLFLCTESTNNRVEILFPFTSQLDNIDIVIKVTKKLFNWDFRKSCPNKMKLNCRAFVFALILNDLFWYQLLCWTILSIGEHFSTRWCPTKVSTNWIVVHLYLLTSWTVFSFTLINFYAGIFRKIGE